MFTSAPPSLCASAPDHLHVVFLTLLPRIELHGRVYFRHLKCPHRQADAIAEMVAVAWRWHQRLAQRGKDVAQFPSALAAYAARAVRSGRRVCGQEKGKDVLSPLAQARHGFAVSSIPNFSTLNGNVFDDALLDNTVTPVDEQVAFRLDFPVWLQRYDDRCRRLIRDLMFGERTLDVAQKYGVSPGRVSQMRRLFQADWGRFQEGPAAINA